MLVKHILMADPDRPLDTVFHHILTRRSDRSFVPGSLPEPTNAIPGSPEKISILKARLEAGLMLHHPNDCVYVRLNRT